MVNLRKLMESKKKFGTARTKPKIGVFIFFYEELRNVEKKTQASSKIPDVNLISGKDEEDRDLDRPRES